ncbi:hypothetical protein GS457_12225 [Rhodococcus hoagii]|nr:hypothetical protein [Prescottella equi]MBM4528847.1 hypothetical protein [Prescottella equi]MBM4545455.1 hypothetical protein [Prescottella equi]MBM4569958.1 hypothetical protein [Prescottella equi]MBM4572224.1 hypothetical protein [Prescottella equi]
MVSQLAWLDHDEQQRRRVMRVIDQFRDEATVDELGLGSVRDTFAGLLLPGLSTLHTRARYLLFIPWLVLSTAHEARDAGKLAPALRRREYSLIHALLAGGETQGVIGGTAKNKLQRLPSGMFWSATAHYGIRTEAKSIDATLRQAFDAARFDRVTDCSDDSGARPDRVPSGFDPRLPKAPENLLAETTFTLTADEAAYLRERMCSNQPWSMFPWLFEHGVDEDAPFLWQHRSIETLEGPLARALDHARRFSTAMAGANVLYNLMVARAKNDDELTEGHTELWRDWCTEVAATDLLGGWDRTAFWRLVHDNNPRVAPPTVSFVDAWITETAAVDPAGTSAQAEALVRRREIQLKGARARLGSNVAAVNAWRGQSGGQLNFNWPVAVRVMRDIIDGQEN